MNEQQYAVKAEFPEPIDGYWDGGKKGGGTFTPKIVRSHILVYSPDSHYPKHNPNEHPGPSHIIKWGCFRLNFWFTCGSGRTWREAASIAKRKLERICTIAGATFKIVELERIDKVSLMRWVG